MTSCREDRRFRAAGIRPSTFEGPGPAVGAVVAATATAYATGGKGFYMGLMIAAGLIAGDITDRWLVRRGIVSPATLLRVAHWTWICLSVPWLALVAFLLVAFVLTGQTIVLAGALIALVTGVAAILWRRRIS
jgi:hypothetical protein